MYSFPETWYQQIQVEVKFIHKIFLNIFPTLRLSSNILIIYSIV